MRLRQANRRRFEALIPPPGHPLDGPYARGCGLGPGVATHRCGAEFVTGTVSPSKNPRCSEIVRDAEGERRGRVPGLVGQGRLATAIQVEERGSIAGTEPGLAVRSVAHVR